MKISIGDIVACTQSDISAGVVITNNGLGDNEDHCVIFIISSSRPSHKYKFIYIEKDNLCSANPKDYESDIVYNIIQNCMYDLYDNGSNIFNNTFNAGGMINAPLSILRDHISKDKDILIKLPMQFKTSLNKKYVIYKKESE